MSIETTSMIDEVNEVVNGPAKPVHFIWYVELLLPDGTAVYPTNILAVDEIDDHHNNYATVMLASVNLLQGDLDYKIYPNKDNITATVIKQPVYESGLGDDLSVRAQRKTYKAILTDTKGAVIENNDPFSTTEENASQQGMVPVTFQLMDRAIDQMRFKLTGGIYGEEVPGDVVKALLTQATKDVNLPVSEMPKGVDMVTPDNSKPSTSVIIRQGIRLTDLADWVQENAGGIYNTGIGYFYCRGVWYVYPEYNVEMFDRASRQITILNVPANKYPGIERSYREDGNNLTIISTGEVSYTDAGDLTQLNQGNGIRFSNAAGFVDGVVEVSGNKATLDRAKTNNEFVAFERADGGVNVPVSGQRITANRFAQMSALAKTNVAKLSVVWENSDPTLISPGMALKFRYLVNNEVREVEGILAGAQSYSAPVGNAMTTDRFKSTTTLNFFVRRSLNW